ncbi:MAG TPA: SoxR reducing system RseC family protein, partial [Candidatus Rifleibacterium sp.]|nr:SoxR reducing system RseC family protein [Candidatus Rifleibacterium sp.]
MSLQGKVTAVEELTVTVEVVPKAECKGCHACSGLTGDGKPGMKAIKAIKGSFFVKPGDEVVLDLNPGEGSIAALLVFGFPMAAFFAGTFGYAHYSYHIARQLFNFSSLVISYPTIWALATLTNYLRQR